ncbi:MAG: 1,4-alpha-glucan branching protein GlgB [Ruminococcaceae bacterium]|nr:1,4-alpha-glucan branching protein GlgB [Oscillospiraceae bacterium]
MAAYFFHQGTNYYAYRYLGFHILSCTDSSTVAAFRVWAPNAKKVYLIGDFNGWDNSLPMGKVTDGGVYEILLPSSTVSDGDNYKFRIITSDGRTLDKADPYAFYTEKPPRTASRIDLSKPFSWSDYGYLKNREKTVCRPGYSIPMNIYEIHLSSWKRRDDGTELTYSEISDELIPYVKQMGYTHVEFMPVMEHPNNDSWGYQITGYYAPTSRLGRPNDLKKLINDLHNAGIGVILDWVPARFPTDAHGLYEFDGKPLYEFQGTDRMEHTGWGTKKFDITRNEVNCFLVSNASYWIEEFHADGLRVDAVASMLYIDYDKSGERNPDTHYGNQSLEAIQFFKKLNGHITAVHPDVLMIAEETSSCENVTKPVSEDGLGFNYKWNTGWANDTLSFAVTEFDYRHDMHSKTNFSIMYAYSENYILPISHAEVVNGKKSMLDKMPGDYWRKFAGSRLFLSYMMLHPGKKLSFMGTEIGQFAEWNCEKSIEWFLLGYEMHKKHQLFVRDLNEFYLSHSQLWRNDHTWDGFRWLRPDDCDNSVSSFMRVDKNLSNGNELLIVINYNYRAREDFIIDVPAKGKYKEIFSSDDPKYGGAGWTNPQPIESFLGEYGNYLLSIKLPPIGVCVFERLNDDQFSTATDSTDNKPEKVSDKKSSDKKETKKKTTKKTAKKPKEDKAKIKSSIKKQNEINKGAKSSV